MQKTFIAMSVFLSSFMYGMNTDNTQLSHTKLFHKAITHLAGYSEPHGKNALMRVCKDFCVCLKDRELIVRANPFTVSLSDKIQSMFIYAISGNYVMIRVLLNAGVIPDHQCRFGLTPYLWHHNRATLK